MRRLSRSRFPSFNWLFFFLIAMKTLLDITSAFVGENSNFFTPEMLQGKPICEVVYLCFFKLHYKIIGFHSTKFVFCVFWSLFLYMYNIIASDCGWRSWNNPNERKNIDEVYYYFSMHVQAQRCNSQSFLWLNLNAICLRLHILYWY